MGRIFSSDKPYKSRYSRSDSAKRGWETRRKNALKKNVYKSSTEATNTQMHDQLQWIFDQVGKDVRREWKDEYEYEDIVDIALNLAHEDKVFTKDEMEKRLKSETSGMLPSTM